MISQDLFSLKSTKKLKCCLQQILLSILKIKMFKIFKFSWLIINPLIALWVKFSAFWNILKYFLNFSQETGFDISDVDSLHDCQILFYGKSKKSIINLLSAEFAQKVVKLKMSLFYFQNVYVNITRILSMAQRLCDAGHYAQNTIRIQAAKLEREWKSLAAALDDRSTVLSMSVMFHKKAETVSFLVIYSFGT